MIADDSAYSIYFLIRKGLPGNLAYFKLAFSFYLFNCVLFFSLADSLYVLATLFRLCEMLVVDDYPVCILNISACNFNNVSSQ